MVPLSLAEDLGKHAETRGAYARLNHAEDSESTDRILPRSDAVRDVVLQLPWNSLSQYNYRSIHHVNLQESRAIKHELRRLVSASFVDGWHQLVLCDSLVSVCAWSKGRSSSYRLNGILRSSLPCLLIGCLILDIIWIDTHSNPGDPPSRGRPWTIPAPLSCTLPGLALFQRQRSLWFVGRSGYDDYVVCKRKGMLCQYFDPECLPRVDEECPPCLILWYASKMQCGDPQKLMCDFELHVQRGLSCALVSVQFKSFWHNPLVQGARSRLGLWFCQFNCTGHDNDVGVAGIRSVATNFPGLLKGSSWRVDDLPAILQPFYATAAGP